MGVSMLKNFDTQVNFFRDNATVLTAMDIEDPNPKRAQTWGDPVVVRAIPTRRFNNSETRESFSRMLKQSKHAAHPCVKDLSLCKDRTLHWPSTRHRRHARGNSVVYETMDQMDSVGWASFANTRRALGLDPFDL
eukprot:5084688-Prymnesium_polylepis.1